MVNAIHLGSLSELEFRMARKRHTEGMTRVLSIANEFGSVEDDPGIDFSAAGLYLVGLQACVSTVACAAVAILCCWILPVSAISAVRTLAVTSAVGMFATRRAWRLGRVRGVAVVFQALRPCVPLYVTALVIEQLAHTCISQGAASGGVWRRVIFHCMTIIMLVSGFARAYRPRSETDLPFLMTTCAVLIVALLPPPISMQGGPLCESSSLFSAGERILRALLFSALYVVHVYCATPRQNHISEVFVCCIRSSAAAAWILGAHALLLMLAPPQGVLALWARFGTEESNSYNAVDTRSEGSVDAEIGQMPGVGLNGLLVAPNGMYSDSATVSSPSESTEVGKENDFIGGEAFPRFPPPIRSEIATRPPSTRGSNVLTFNLSPTVPHTQLCSQERMAEIASTL